MLLTFKIWVMQAEILFNFRSLCHMLNFAHLGEKIEKKTTPNYQKKKKKKIWLKT